MLSCRYEGLDLLSLRRVARELAGSLRAGMVVALRGNLGVGKTAFSREIIGCFSGEDFLGSPTFSLVHEYSTPAFSLYHVDLYRLSTLKEVQEVGFFDFCDNNLVLVEWPDILDGVVPFDVNVRIMHSSDIGEMVRDVEIEWSKA
ncbi:tRNA threonylcarbamoyladenosine biosynthesis protein TsaE [Anaplasma phagocytophilum]|uniref:tRNA (adenosine(37)-N6)-threonylcarbamoyltransferase complex ATPase subunit type 1 TsaE n=1 Tax=Anaplasma phagocytophilum TaxID=948 RepID=UPI0007E06D36|nr:tRNA (adenosine(37)-N6)-threonylcarbamoyltransferase complex ATPase subunit type 1 TsaE [Anaplasma phagocytophilum]SCV63296.1 tRNA threonylcarbamoyladenosine biosynthesis protein TsaE [Anaplasma phagocytophilum]SCV65962.1 tRNA threonylcarbamoyladenosine biosynthesis protein TsaE [Anaplasma phagocytophilum]